MNKTQLSLGLLLAFAACSSQSKPSEHGETDAGLHPDSGGVHAGACTGRACPPDAGQLADATHGGSSRDGGPIDGGDLDGGDRLDGALQDGGHAAGDAGADAGSDAGADAGSVLSPQFDYQMDRTGISGLDAQTIAQLKQGGPSCTVAVRYPYEGTVFPVGLAPPTIMWTGGAEAAHVSISYDSSQAVKYEYAAASTGELTIPAQDWNEITRRTPSAPLRVKLDVKNGSTISTCNLSWRIAPGKLAGAIYYDTYNFPDVAGTRAVMRLNLGSSTAQLYLKDPSPNSAPPSGPCVGCHSLSASGNMMVASRHFYDSLILSQLDTDAFTASSYDVTGTLQPQPKSRVADATFGGLTPDGKYVLQMGNPQCTANALTFPRAPANFMLVQGPVQAGLLSTADGTPVAVKGLNQDWYLWMPQFSPTGDKVVFNHARPNDPSDPIGKGTNRGDLAVMDYDPNTKTFSNLKVIVSGSYMGGRKDYAPSAGSGINALAGFTPDTCTPALSGNDSLGHIPNGSCDGPCYPAWPSFTPDGNGVIFSLISEPDFAVTFPGRDVPSKSELWYVDLTTGAQVKLANANQALAGEDTQINYYPSVFPVQVGGYYWVFWTSTRRWGTRSTDAPADAVLYGSAFGPNASDNYKKRIWVSAIRPRLTSNGSFSSDPLEDLSSPPFYLPGQSETGNMRPVATVHPCKPAGQSCESGLDCCAGFCSLLQGESTGSCVEQVTCSRLNERCETNANCCLPEGGSQAMLCIGGYCGIVQP